MTGLPIDDVDELLASIASRIPSHIPVSLALEFHGIRRSVTLSDRDVRVFEGGSRKFHLACSYKTILALMAAKLAASKDLSLEAPIEYYLSSLQSSVVGHEVQVRHLLSQTTGLLLEYRAMTSDAIEEQFLRSQLLFAPGSVFSQDLSAAMLLGKVLERVVGKGKGKTCRSLLVETLAMNEDDFLLIEDNIFASQATLPGLLSIARTMLQGSAVTSDMAAKLEPSARLHLLVPVVGIPRSRLGKTIFPTAYSLGLGRFEGNFFGAEGTYIDEVVGLYFHIESGLILAVGINDRDPLLRAKIVRLLMSELLCDRDGLPSSKSPPTLADFAIADLEGVYVGQGGLTTTVKSDRQTLVVVLSSARKRIVQFQGEIGPEREVTFNRGASPLSPTFFFDRETNALCLMMGMQAFKRSRSRTLFRPHVRKRVRQETWGLSLTGSIVDAHGQSPSH